MTYFIDNYGQIILTCRNLLDIFIDDTHIEVDGRKYIITKYNKDVKKDLLRIWVKAVKTDKSM